MGPLGGRGLKMSNKRVTRGGELQGGGYRDPSIFKKSLSIGVISAAQKGGTTQTDPHGFRAAFQREPKGDIDRRRVKH